MQKNHGQHLQSFGSRSVKKNRNESRQALKNHPDIITSSPSNFNPNSLTPLTGAMLSYSSARSDTFYITLPNTLIWTATVRSGTVRYCLWFDCDSSTTFATSCIDSSLGTVLALTIVIGSRKSVLRNPSTVVLCGIAVLLEKFECETIITGWRGCWCGYWRGYWSRSNRCPGRRGRRLDT